MLKSVIRTLLLALLVCCSTVVFAQKQDVHVVVKDSLNSHGVNKATVVLLASKDSALLGFGVTDSTGKYSFKNVNFAKPSFVSVSAVGFKDESVVLPLTTVRKGEDYNLQVLLVPDFKALQDVVISGKASPMRMNKDTMEFNADYFKTHPNAVLEDLLRKIPGLEIRNETEVFVNGQRVSRILVDGKEFFSSDPVVILKNLPAEIIAKVQVADERNTIAKETRETKDIPKTINLKLKKEIKGGVFGKFFGGYGTDGRYEAGGLLNAFKDTFQVSLIGSSNNQGRGGFSMEDLNNMGGFGRSGNLGSQNAWGVQSGGWGGIQKKHLGGVNLNYNIGKNIQLNGQYFYNKEETRTENKGLSEQLLGDSSLFSSNNSGGIRRNAQHKASVGINWKQDSTGYLTARFATDMGDNMGFDTSSGMSYSAKVPLLSRSINMRSASGNSSNLNGFLNYSKTIRKLKLDWSFDAGFSKSNSESLDYTDNQNVRITNSFIPDSVKQRRNNFTPNTSFNFSNRLNKNWGKKDNHTAGWEIAYNWNKEEQGGDTYQYSAVTGKDELNPLMSVRLIQNRYKIKNSLFYRFNYKRLNVTAGVDLNNLKLDNSYTSNIASLSRSFNMLSPRVQLNFRGISLSYNKDISAPYSFYLRPYTDSSNLMYISSGNPDLKPSKDDNISLNYYTWFQKPQISLNFYGSAKRSHDGVSETRDVASDGKMVSTYVNVDAISSYYGGMYISKSFYKNNWNYSAGLNGNFNVNVSPIILNGVLLRTTSTSLSPSVTWHVGYKNLFRWNFSYSLSFSESKSEDATVRRTEALQHSFSNRFHWQITPKLSWDANLRYNSNPSIPDGYKRNWTFLDMAVTYGFLKKDRAQVKLSAFDILNQNEGIYRYAYQNYISVSQQLVQKQYFMLTLFYSIKKL